MVLPEHLVLIELLSQLLDLILQFRDLRVELGVLFFRARQLLTHRLHLLSILPLPLFEIVDLRLFVSQLFVQLDVHQLPLLLFFHCFLHQANLHQYLLVGRLDVLLFVLEELDLVLELFDLLLILLVVFLFLYPAFHLFHLLLQLAILTLQLLAHFLLLFHFEI